MGGGECVSMLEMRVMMMLWKKLAVNCDAIDPLMAIHNDVTNEQSLSIRSMVPIMSGGYQDDCATNFLEEVSLVAMMEMRSLNEETITSSSDVRRRRRVWRKQ